MVPKMAAVFLLAFLGLIKGQNLHKVAKAHCTATLNQLRVARGLGKVQWNEFLVQLSDLKGLQLVVSDIYDETDKNAFKVPELDRQAMESDHITFNSETMTRELDTGLPGQISDLHRQLFYSYLVDDILRTWYMDGLFSDETVKAKFDQMMDSTVDQIGCTMHSIPVNDTMYKIYFVVAYQQNKQKLEQYNDLKLSRSSGGKTQLSPSDRACSVKCSFVGSCYSHKQSVGYVGSRTGRGSASLPGSMPSRGCWCEADPQLPAQQTPFEKPRCLETCFVHCPLASDKKKMSCYGKTYCTCLYAQGGAVCI